jgi:hypothetical protein
MARIKMLAISQMDADEKVKLIGADRLNLPGHDDFACGHCDYTIFIAFDLARVPGDPAFQCRNCEEFNLLPRTLEVRRKQG